MSAQTTIAKLRKAIDEARARSMSDESIIDTLVQTLMPEQLVALLGESDPNLSGAITKALWPTAAENVAKTAKGDEFKLQRTNKSLTDSRTRAIKDVVFVPEDTRKSTGPDIGDAIERAFNGKVKR